MRRFSEFKQPMLNKQPQKTKKLVLEAVEKNDVETFFSKLFESKEMAHVYHLQVKGDQGSHAKHLALGEYYESITDMIDEIIEVYQGQYDLLENYEIIDTASTKNTDPKEYFKGVASFIMENKKCISEKDTHIHSLIDNIVCLMYRTIYKLKYTK